jgi:hypothetical protein
MNNSIKQFNNSIQNIRDLTSTIERLDNITTNLVDFSDLYRSQIVLVISSLDHFIHEFVLEEMLEIYNGRRNATNSFNAFTVPISSFLQFRPTDSFIASHIRQKNSWLSFQDPDKIADAIRHISDKKIWEEVSPEFRLNAGDIKTKLKLVVDRRNKIAHEADIDPSFPSRKWPISITDVRETIDFIEKLANELYRKVK